MKVELDFSRPIREVLESKSDAESVFVLDYRGEISEIPVYEICFLWRSNDYYVAWSPDDNWDTCDLYRIKAVAEIPKIAKKDLPNDQ